MPRIMEWMEAPPSPHIVSPFDGPSLIWAGLVSMPLLWWGASPSFYYLAWIAMIPMALAAVLALPGIRALLSPLSARGRPIELDWRGRRTLFAWLGLVLVLLAFQVPLRVHFALAKPGLVERVESLSTPEHWTAFYEIGEARQGRCDHRRILLPIENDIESFFVYAPYGMEGFCYNSGSTGSFGGGWYWATED